MTKVDISGALRAQLGLTKVAATAAVDLVLGEISAALARGDEVRLAHFGAFELRTIPARQGKGIDGKPYQSAAKHGVRFKASTTVLKALPTPAAPAA